MSEPLLTEEERKEVGLVAAFMVGYHIGAGLRPCFILFTETTGWNTPLAVCACNYPQFEVKWGNRVA